ncbi:ABC transporter permease [Glycomyces rhizosphaerae]|uniref:ABC transporter permease n=1 Tax=Glycomyces rhizosphaerae TaxID=2054422 RepID=A0ABV7PXM2_9ACTN
MTTAVAELENGLGTLAGTGKLLRFQARRTRVYLIGWFTGLVGGTWLMASAFPDLYPTAEDRAQYAMTVNTPAMRSMTGPETYIDAYAASTGAMFAHNMMLWTGALTAVMFILLIIRVTRADEETSRLEVIRSEPVGRRADLAAALLLATITAVVLGLLIALSVAGIDGVDAGGALLYGATHAAIGLVFAGVAAVAAQLGAFGSSANGIGFGALSVSVLFAAVGSAQGNWVAWLSPVGWSQSTYVMTPEQRWWPLAVSAVFGLLAVWLAFALVTHRDFGQGMMAGRAGRAEADASLSGIGTLTFRLTRGLMWAAVITMVLLGAAYGSVIGSADDMLETLSETQQQVLNQGGASIEENFAATIAAISALFATLFGLLVVGRARKEETGGRGELLAAGAVPRSGWPGSYLPVALTTVTVAVVVGGALLAVTGSSSLGDWGFFGKLFGASVLQLPAVWVLTAFAFAAYAWLPRLGWLRWLAWIFAFVVAYYGQLLDMPGWLMAVSPFDHIAKYPAQEVEWLPITALVVVAAALAALGYAGARRRDLHFS